MSALSLHSVAVENLRGYFNATLDLTREKILIVGPNNSGKTSILKLLDWLFNGLRPRELIPQKEISDNERTLLLPARNTKHRARRLTLRIQIDDGRSWSKFQCDSDGISTLRLNIRLTPETVVYTSLGAPKSGEKAESQPNAIELLERIQEAFTFRYIPSFRDVRSERFSNSISSAFQRRIEQKALHSTQAGFRTEQKKVSNANKSLRETILKLAEPLWDEMRLKLPPGIVRDAVLDLNCDQKELLRFLEQRLSLKVSTGDHDAGHVDLDELGSGLQSLLDLAIQESEASSVEGRSVIIAVEEPEAFLHPAAQRTVSFRLLKSTNIAKAIVTTHSSIVIEEAKYGDVAICSDHRFFQPNLLSESDREEINTALLSSYGAEMMFAKSVLFVEGEGDKEFFEQIRRRISQLDKTGQIDQCFVVPTGGNSSFAPWIRLVRSYGYPTNRPISWLIACDSDSTSKIRTAFQESGQSIEADLSNHFEQIVTAVDNAEHMRKAVQLTINYCDKTTTRVHFLELDLEEAMLSNISAEFLDTIKAKLGIIEQGFQKDDLLKKLGAKWYQPGDKPIKAPWVRAYIGRNIPPQDLSANVAACLERWFSGAMQRKSAKQLVAAWMQSA